MSDYLFTHGGEIPCPHCKLTGEQKVSRLCYAHHNYSGCSTDVGHCEECGRGYEISFRVNLVTHVPEWNGLTRVEREASEARARAAEVEARRQEYLRLKKEFEP